MDKKPSNWPFEAWLRLAVLHMKISPESFWDMPVRDWFWLCRVSQKQSVSWDDFQGLFEQFPDER